jgi:hypothetical protein
MKISTALQLRDWAEVHRSIFPEYFVRNQHNRSLWMRENEGCTILSFYNTGRNLFVEPNGLPADSFFHESWLWIRFQTFKNRSKFRVTKKQKGWGGLMRLRHRGHNSDGSVALSLAPPFKSKESAITKRIWPKNIIFFAISEGKIQSVLVQYQPLPIRLFQTLQEELETVR